MRSGPAVRWPTEATQFVKQLCVRCGARTPGVDDTGRRVGGEEAAGLQERAAIEPDEREAMERLEAEERRAMLRVLPELDE